MLSDKRKELKMLIGGMILLVRFGTNYFSVYLLLHLTVVVAILLFNAASWDSNKHSGAVPQLTGARFFSFEELKKNDKQFFRN